jgi:hypothetical protein
MGSKENAWTICFLLANTAPKIFKVTWKEVVKRVKPPPQKFWKI